MEELEGFFLSNIWEAVKAFIASVNLMFMLIFMIITWLINAGASHPTKAKSLTWITKVHPALFPLILGFILAVGYAYLNDMRTKAEIAGLLYGVLLGMVIWKIGINKFEAWLNKKLFNK